MSKMPAQAFCLIFGLLVNILYEVAGQPIQNHMPQVNSFPWHAQSAQRKAVDFQVSIQEGKGLNLISLHFKWE